LTRYSYRIAIFSGVPILTAVMTLHATGTPDRKLLLLVLTWHLCMMALEAFKYSCNKSLLEKIEKSSAKSSI
jgi:hypothetical protein